MFRPNCRAIFRLIFEQVECDNCTLHMYVYIYILAYIQHSGDVSLKKMDAKTEWKGDKNSEETKKTGRRKEE